jgi:hypothetical protein
MPLIGSVRKVGACRQTDRNLGERSRRWQGQRRRRRTGTGKGTGRLLPASKIIYSTQLPTIPLDPVREKRTKPTVLTSRLTGNFILGAYLDSSWTR